MIAPVDAVTSAKLFAASILAGALAARCLMPDIAKTRVAIGALLVVLVCGGAAHLAWVFGSDWAMQYRGEVASMVMLCMLVLMVLSVPIAALFRRITRALVIKRDTVPTLGRRAILSAATALAPGLALGGGVSGFVSGASETSIKRVRFTYPDLPTDLVGLRVLHLSDLHLGADKNIEDLEAFLDRLRGDAPDLIVFTGDVAEDPSQLDPALTAAIGLNPRLGVYASLGNHEYLEGIDRALSVYRRRKDVRLLVDEGECIRVGSSRLWVGGTDDPLFVRADPVPFLTRSVRGAVVGAPADAFRLLMCHRPEGFIPAQAWGVELTLAGHTHGGQIGFNGKSAFERIWPDQYLWGEYSKGRSRLYTTSGFGHWFPFRVGCPTEAPIIELARA